MGVIFEYPSKWHTVRTCKEIYGVDTLLYRDYTNFGITEISEDELKIRVNNALMNFWWSRHHVKKENTDDAVIHANASFYHYQPKSNYHYNPIVVALKSCTQKDEIILHDVILNKHKIGNRNNKSLIYSASILLCIYDKSSGYNLFHERTLLIQENNQRKNKAETPIRRCFLIAFVDLPENFESGKSQRQLKEIFESFRFI